MSRILRGALTIACCAALLWGCSKREQGEQCAGGYDDGGVYREDFCAGDEQCCYAGGEHYACFPRHESCPAPCGQSWWVCAAGTWCELGQSSVTEPTAPGCPALPGAPRCLDDCPTARQCQTNLCCPAGSHCAPNGCCASD